MSARTPARARNGRTPAREVPPIFDDLSDTEIGTPRRPRTRAATAALRQRKSETPGPGTNGQTAFGLAQEETNGHATGSSTSSAGGLAPGTPTPAPRTNGHSVQNPVEKEGLLSPPMAQPGWRTISRSPSPLGLIPIHRTFSSLVRSPVDYFRWWIGCTGEEVGEAGGVRERSASRTRRRKISASRDRSSSTSPSRRRKRSKTPPSHRSSLRSSSPRRSRATSRSPHLRPRDPLLPNPSSFQLTMAQIHRHEVPRKLLHVSIGGFCLYFYKNGWQPSDLTPYLAAALVPIASADLLRFSSPRFNAFYIRVLGALMRESEVKGWNGVVWYIVGTLSVLCIFPKDVAVLSILLLSWCDTAASTFGRIFGHLTPRVRARKSLAGCIASFLVGAASAAYFWGVVMPSTPAFHNDPVVPNMWTGKLGGLSGAAALVAGSLWTGLVASASEVVDVFGLDDNVIIPVLSAVGIWGFLKAFA